MCVLRSSVYSVHQWLSLITICDFYPCDVILVLAMGSCLCVCCNYFFLKLAGQYTNTSSPKSFGKSALLPLRRRMHSPTVSAIYTIQCVTKHYEALRYVMEALRIVTECYGALTLTERYRTVTENIDYAHYWFLNFAHHYNVGNTP